MEAGSQHGEEDKTTSGVESWMKRTFSRYFRVVSVVIGFCGDTKFTYVRPSSSVADQTCDLDWMSLETQPESSGFRISR